MEFKPQCFLSTFMLVYCACDLCTVYGLTSAYDVTDRHANGGSSSSAGASRTAGNPRTRRAARGPHAGARRTTRGAGEGSMTRVHQLAAAHLLDNSTVTSLNMSLTHDGHAVIVDWEFESNESRITGFVVCYRMSEREDYDSSKLDLRVRRFTLHSLHEDEEYEICVHAMVNYTVVREVCSSWSQASRKMVVGIAVGCLFLCPLTAVIVWFYLKDQQIRKKYADLYGKEVEVGFDQATIKPKQIETKKANMSNGCERPKINCNHEHHKDLHELKANNKSHNNAVTSTQVTDSKAVISKNGSDENIDV